LVEQGKVRHSIKPIRFEDVNENIELLRSGDIVGRAVIRYWLVVHRPNVPRGLSFFVVSCPL
jgi:hypothetical protein